MQHGNVRKGAVVAVDSSLKTSSAAIPRSHFLFFKLRTKSSHSRIVHCKPASISPATSPSLPGGHQIREQPSKTRTSNTTAPMDNGNTPSSLLQNGKSRAMRHRARIIAHRAAPGSAPAQGFVQARRMLLATRHRLRRSVNEGKSHQQRSDLARSRWQRSPPHAA